MTQDDTPLSYIELQKAGKLQQMRTLQWYILHGQKMPQMSMALVLLVAELCSRLFLLRCLSFRRHTMVDKAHQRRRFRLSPLSPLSPRSLRTQRFQHLPALLQRCVCQQQCFGSLPCDLPRRDSHQPDWIGIRFVPPLPLCSLCS